ncbi:MAG: hypothetical protein E6K94_09890 [Thaumarchaeota archaeon]|nr:MAG: hypothetical protein E6K94_09890 [Nitrososphaerota archaeon]
MTSKKVVYLSSAIFGAIGILVSVAIIALNGGFSGNGPSILNPPTSKDQWSIGSNIVDGLNLTYSLTSIGEESSLRDSIVSIKFHELKDKWNINFKINNGSTVKESSANFSKKQLLITDPITQENEKFIQPVESSILAIRDIAREPKYLVVGAVWDKIFTGSSTIDVKIANTDTISISKDSYKVYVLQSKVGNSISKIYLNKDLPLPIKADVYDDNDKVVYQYELQSVLK